MVDLKCPHCKCDTLEQTKNAKYDTGDAVHYTLKFWCRNPNCRGTLNAEMEWEK
jgi:hypothetical protein